MDSEEPVGREFFKKTAEGVHVAETAFGPQATQRVVSHGFQEIDVVRVDGHASELGDINKDPTDTAHSCVFSMGLRF